MGQFNLGKFRSNDYTKFVWPGWYYLKFNRGFSSTTEAFPSNQEFSDDIEFDDAQNVNGFFSGDEPTIDDLNYEDVSDEESDMETE